MPTDIKVTERIPAGIGYDKDGANLVRLYDVQSAPPLSLDEIWNGCAGKSGSEFSGKIPKFGTVWGGSGVASGMRAINYDIDDAGGGDFEIRVRYAKNEPEPLRPTPTGSDVVISCRPYPIVVPIERDLSGKPVVNSAGEKFDPPVTMEVTAAVITIDKMDNSISANDAVSTMNTVNSGSVTVAGVSIANGRGKILNVEPVKTKTTSGDYTRVHIEVGVMPAGYTWDEPILDIGYNRLSGSGITRCTDVTGAPVVSPIRLDGTGQPMPATATSGVYIQFTRVVSSSWSALNLPSSW